MCHSHNHPTYYCCFKLLQELLTQNIVCRQHQLVGVSDSWQHSLLLFMKMVWAMSHSQPPVADRWIELCNHQWKLEIFCLRLSSCGEAPTAFCLPVEMVAAFPPSVKLWSGICIKEKVHPSCCWCIISEIKERLPHCVTSKKPMAATIFSRGKNICVISMYIICMSNTDVHDELS